MSFPWAGEPFLIRCARLLSTTSPGIQWVVGERFLDMQYALYVA